METKTLNRQVFETSRVLEYFTEKELRAQIGYDKPYWPVAILRELIDNALDGCEKINVAPVIEVNIKDDIITVSDNGPGIPLEIINKSLDYLVRVSDKAYYISPTRGQMGNALKVIYAAPFVHTGEGYVEITANNEMHHIEVKMDRIAGQPKIDNITTPFVKNGTFVKIYYPNSTRLLLEPDYDNNEYYYNEKPPTAIELIQGYVVFNPHATFILNGEQYQPTNKDWKKWTPDMPTSAHWYNVETLSDLVAGYLTKERSENGHKKTIREFVSEFCGLAGTAKQKKIIGEYSRANLNIFEKDGDIDRQSLQKLLINMQAESIAPKPDVLGLIGLEHLKNWIINQGGSEPTIKYSKKKGYDDDGLPYVIEVGFAINKDNNAKRIMITGLNWSPVIGEPPDSTLQHAIQEARLDPHDPVIFIIHIARPRFEFMDRGKTKIQL